ncbi:Plasmodium exported protein, unknown function [Plasmodium ovale wallikeri]|uniref:Pv-fam-d protein n=1 Tax=Plasmodium ovale wallikeri TaxID=864142 RepID=A0A1A9AMR5_PLAOA|nr:Plasmodium exported protein, unknown function [Plasmodium ovale wallikeri]SBT57481.1 Plasmodium exported protein, unknown function [Plasmodium ovale wallikeri]
MDLGTKSLKSEYSQTKTLKTRVNRLLKGETEVLYTQNYSNLKDRIINLVEEDDHVFGKRLNELAHDNTFQNIFNKFMYDNYEKDFNDSHYYDYPDMPHSTINYYDDFNKGYDGLNVYDKYEKPFNKARRERNYGKQYPVLKNYNKKQRPHRTRMYLDSYKEESGLGILKSLKKFDENFERKLKNSINSRNDNDYDKCKIKNARGKFLYFLKKCKLYLPPVINTIILIMMAMAKTVSGGAFTFFTVTLLIMLFYYGIKFYKINITNIYRKKYAKRNKINNRRYV